MKRFLTALLLLTCLKHAYAADVETAPIANVEYIHKYIKQKWGIDIAYNPELASVKQAANMKYLLTLVDIANTRLNGFKTSSYGTGQYATTQVTNTIATVKAVDTLIRLQDVGTFWYITDDTVTTPTFDIQEGRFIIDWGDGTQTEAIHTPTAAHTAYPHRYTDGVAQHTVRISGRATKYSGLGNKPDAPAAAIQFWSTSNNLLGVGGCLGCVFPTIGSGDEDGQQPTFFKAFLGQKNIKELPVGFFDGVHGKPSHGMFHSTFQESGLESIPNRLFTNINGSAADVINTFRDTFNRCGNLAEIPANLFGDITDVEKREFFWGMFYGDGNLTGPAPKINGKYIWDWWPNLQTQMFTGCHLDEQDQMPPGYRN